MKTRFTIGALVTGLALAITGCSSDTGSSSTTAPPDNPATDAVATTPAVDDTTAAGTDDACTESLGTLTMWVDQTRADALQDVVAQFKAEKCVTIEMVTKAWDDLRKDFTTQVSAGQGPDITVGAADWLGELKGNGLVAPIMLGDVANQLVPSAVEAYTSEGQIYGVPYAMENIALIRNNALAPDTKATTFDELITEAKAVGKDYSVLLQIGENGDPYHMAPLQNSFGAPIFKADANGELTSELAMGGQAGQAFATWLAAKGKEGVFSRDVTGDIAKQAFIEGKAPYVITGPWNVPDFSAAGLDISVLPIPSAGGQPATPFLGVPGFYLSAKSPNALLAGEFLMNYVTRADVQLALFQAGGRIPASIEAQADPAVSGDPIAMGFAAIAADAVATPAILAMNQVWTPLGTTEVEILTGTAKDPAKAWDDMVGNITTAIAKTEG